MTAKNLSLFSIKIEKDFGGSLLKNSHAKRPRPITTRVPMHVVLRASRARGALSLLKKDREIQKVLRDQGQAFGVKVYKCANAGNHLHLIVLPRSREAFKGFFRSVSGIVARKILGVERGRAQGLRFWDQRPFSRIISWGRDFRKVKAYLTMNILEAIGFLPPRKSKDSRRSSTAVPRFAGP